MINISSAHLFGAGTIRRGLWHSEASSRPACSVHETTPLPPSHEPPLQSNTPHRSTEWRPASQRPLRNCNGNANIWGLSRCCEKIFSVKFLETMRNLRNNMVFSRSNNNFTSIKFTIWTIKEYYRSFTFWALCVVGTCARCAKNFREPIWNSDCGNNGFDWNGSPNSIKSSFPSVT